MVHRVLIIEDDPGIAAELGDRLCGLGVVVVHATDAEVGFCRALETGPDLILLDLQMPHQDGVAAAERLLAHRALNRTPMLFFTAERRPSAEESSQSLEESQKYEQTISMGQIIEQAQVLLRESPAS